METDHFPNAIFTHHVLKTQTVIKLIMFLLLRNTGEGRIF